MSAADEHIPINSDFEDELHEAGFAKRGCCFWMPCFRSEEYDRSSTVRSNWWERVTAAEQKDDVDSVHIRRNWWSKGLDAVKKVREWSELVAGPKWKTFIRRFNKHRPSAKQGSKFQYDPLSYSLNFDEGNGGENGNFDFSARFAPVSAKSSMDLGKDFPAFT